MAGAEQRGHAQAVLVGGQGGTKRQGLREEGPVLGLELIFPLGSVDFWAHLHTHIL